MSVLTREDFPFGEWVQHDTARCPEDDSPVELCRRLTAKPVGSFSLAGMQMKFSCLETWEARCTTVIYGETYSDYLPDRRANQVLRLRNSGMLLDFVVEADPYNSARLFEKGFNVMHFMHAQYARPTWRPDFEREITPWEELVQQETAIRLAKAADKRMDV
jgi:hypothetical protein